MAANLKMLECFQRQMVKRKAYCSNEANKKLFVQWRMTLLLIEQKHRQSPFKTVILDIKQKNYFFICFALIPIRFAREIVENNVHADAYGTCFL